MVLLHEIRSYSVALISFFLLAFRFKQNFDKMYKMVGAQEGQKGQTSKIFGGVRTGAGGRSKRCYTYCL